MRPSTVVKSLAAIAILALVAVGPIMASATSTTTHVTLPFIGPPFFVPCAAGGTGDVVVATGEMDAIFHSTVDDAGGTHIVLHIRPDITGEGLITGDRYKATGPTNIN